jgi:uncharacterized protein (DUF983 family)
LTRTDSVNAFLAGALGRCPRCGKGPLFAGFLRLTGVCSVCACPLAAADSGDGPAVFVILLAGFLMVFGALFTQIAFRPPVWLQFIIWLPLGAGLCLALLRPMKGLMVAAQIHNRAAEHRRDERG